jgi:glycosyltransferase involved in cell wall biosynthesis
MNVLWLTSWYPSRASMLSGDFIERHAQAAALMNHTYVIHVVKDTTGQVKKVTREERFYKEDLTAVIYYYPSFKHLGVVVDTLLSNIYFLRLHTRAWNEYRNKYGKPAGILVQVGIKAGIIAWLRAKTTGIPYILFERWTGFLPDAYPNFRRQPALLRMLWKSTLKHARELVTASTYFGEEFKKLYNAKSYTVVPNYINTELFYYKKKSAGRPFRFIHISTLDYQKNFLDLLDAFEKLVKQDAEVELIVYGPILDELLKETEESGLMSKVIFKGEVLHAEIAKALQDSDVLVLCSYYETFGNVVMEANACGLPVIVSDLPVFHEMVTAGENGIFISPEDVPALTEKMLWIKNNIHRFDGEKIAAAAKARFSKEKVAALFDALYKKHFT